MERIGGKAVDDLIMTLIQSQQTKVKKGAILTE